LKVTVVQEQIVVLSALIFICGVMVLGFIFIVTTSEAGWDVVSQPPPLLMMLQVI
jgi:hypothetical protein